ncbi:MAG TPA: GNAT family N-acetyltransferase [Blastocatellia bacterium]|nr:GNAT family N-acetyltransferase [Blastocatellia bacterium]
MNYSIHVENQPDERDVKVLWQGLHEHNTRHSGSGEAAYLAIFLRDEQGEVVAGVYGWSAVTWLKIDVLWVREDLRGRGFGKQLLLAAEAEGMRRGCSFAILDSFSFQAPDLYKKNGYDEFAVLENPTGNQTWHYLKKDLRIEKGNN